MLLTPIASTLYQFTWGLLTAIETELRKSLENRDSGRPNLSGLTKSPTRRALLEKVLEVIDDTDLLKQCAAAISVSSADLEKEAIITAVLDKITPYVARNERKRGLHDSDGDE